MRLIRHHKFGEIHGYEFGRSIIGSPLMTAFLYIHNNLMIDTGLSHMEHEILEIVKSHHISKVLLTHHHEDHSGNAAALNRTLNIPVYGHEHTVHKMKKGFRILPYQHYAWGHTTPLFMKTIPDVIEGNDICIRSVYTPGHSKDHMVYYDSERGIIFSGDLYLADRIKFFRSDEIISDQIKSLKKILDLDFERLLCSHYPKIDKGYRHIEVKLQFLEDFFGNIQKYWEMGYHEKGIFKKLELIEQYGIKWFCFGNVSMMNGVRSVVKSLEENTQ